MHDVAVIGAGPAGLFAAERLAAAGRSVTVFERMASPARKFLLAGRGGLNLTNSEPLDRLLARYGGCEPVQDAVRRFPPDALRAWAASLGEETVIGSSGRIFPASFKASPLLRAWLRRLAALGVELRPRHRWLGWTEDGALRFDSPAGEAHIRPHATLLALGGASWPRLGADGTWVGLLRERGIAVARLQPSNAGVKCAWTPAFAERIAGAPLKRIAAEIGGHRVRGEAVITRDGLEGGVVYALSREIRAALELDGQARLTLDLRPDLDDAALARRMGGPAVSRANAWRRAGLGPAAAALLRETGGEPKRTEIRVTALAGLDRAISTAGGIRLSELGPGFALRALPGVFAAGEMLDWDAPTGGYLLQACFGTAWAAAEAVLSSAAPPQSASAPVPRSAP